MLKVRWSADGGRCRSLLKPYAAPDSMRVARLATSSKRPILSTGGGDRGFTYDPVTRGWVPKWHPCIEFAGALDEAEAATAFARVLAESAGLENVASVLKSVEELLFRIGFAVAGRNCITDSDIKWVESLERRLASTTMEFLDSFRLNGSTVEAAAIAIARTAVRRAERLYWRCVRLRSSLDEPALRAGKLLNRLSDMLFLLQLETDKIKGKEPPRVKCR